MKSIVLNERELLERALTNGEVSEDYNDTADVLIRHYLHLGYDKNETYMYVDKFFVDNMDTYRSSAQMRYIKSKINLIYSGGRFELVNIKGVNITNKEWDIISSISDDKIAKIMFVLLVKVKLYMAKNRKNTPVIIVNLKEVLREVSVNTKEDNMFLFNELTRLGLITTRLVRAGNSNKYHTMVRVHFIDINDKDAKKEVDNFNNVITYFNELYKGWKYKVCTKCGIRFRVSKTGKPPVYCKKCAYDRKKVSIASSNKKRRDALKK